MQGRLSGGKLRFRLSDVGRSYLAGIETIARVLQRPIENAYVVLLHLQIGGVARHIHVDGRRRQQHGLLHHAQSLARSRNLTFSLPDAVGGALAVEQRLRAAQSNRARCRQAFSLERYAIRQIRRQRRYLLLGIGILSPDRDVGGNRRTIAGQRLRHAFVGLPHNGALRVQLRIVLVGFGERCFHRLRGGHPRRGNPQREAQSGSCRDRA